MWKSCSYGDGSNSAMSHGGRRDGDLEVGTFVKVTSAGEGQQGWKKFDLVCSAPLIAGPPCAGGPAAGPQRARGTAADPQCAEGQQELGSAPEMLRMQGQTSAGCCMGQCGWGGRTGACTLLSGVMLHHVPARTKVLSWDSKLLVFCIKKGPRST